MSIHEAKVIKITNIIDHDNADSLQIVKIWGYDCIVKKGDFKIGDLAVYLEPDTKIDTCRPPFQFLAKTTNSGGMTVTQYGKHRITAKRLRGKWSEGLLIKAPEGFKEGDDCWDYFGLERWEPQESNLLKSSNSGGGKLGSSHAVKGPEFQCPYYDLQNLKKYSKVINPDETVMITTKLHGSQAKYCYHNGQMFCGSRNQWRKKPGYYFVNHKNKFILFIINLVKFISGNKPEKVFNFFLNLPNRWARSLNQYFTYVVSENAWWKAYDQNPWIGEFCKKNPNVVLYGEIIGNLIQGKNFHYGLKDNEIGFYVFDILQPEYKYDAIKDKTEIICHKWLDNQKLHFDAKFNEIKKVPLLYVGKYNINTIAELAEMKETLNNANHVREGVVVKLLNEREDDTIGRVGLKYVSLNYLSKN